jgi:hypothetical protein
MPDLSGFHDNRDRPGEFHHGYPMLFVVSAATAMSLPMSADLCSAYQGRVVTALREEIAMLLPLQQTASI